MLFVMRSRACVCVCVCVTVCDGVRETGPHVNAHGYDIAHMSRSVTPGGRIL